MIRPKDGSVPGFLARKRNILIGVALLVFALALLSGGRSGPMSRSAGARDVPGAGVFSAIAQSIGSIADRYIFQSSAEEDIATLRTEVSTLKQELLKVKEYEYENKRLKALLGFKEATEFSLLPARVTGRSASAWYRTLTLDKGIADGVKVGSPVVTANGVVGRVYETGGSVCRVLLITDASSAVDALLQRSRAQVVVEGDAGPNPRLLYLARGVDAEVGDKVLTSGLDGIYPKGLLLGEISRLKNSPGDIFQAAKIEPSVDFSNIEEVFLILGSEEKMM